MSRDYEQDKTDIFEQPVPVEDADAAIYGPVEIPDSGRIVAKPVSINAIWADPRQPRRAIPGTLQLHWNGDPAQVADLLSAWHLRASAAAGITVSIPHVLQAWNDGYDGKESAPPIFVEYVALLQLAQSIWRQGLINPITVVQQSANRYVIETGERRWLAFHILRQYMGAEKWGRIPAVLSDGKNTVWIQATENTARRSLNAIGMARQLSLLVMDARQGIEGQTYADYDEVVQPGVCDRRYYAQVANGNRHAIPRGLGPRIQSTMALSEAQLSQYRRLLKLTDDEQVNDVLWVRADVEAWTENALRRIGALTAVKLREMVLSANPPTLEDLIRLAEASPAPEKTPEAEPAQRVFERGEAVMVRMTDELGEVQTAYWDAGGLYVAIRINGESGVYKADDLLTTGMSYEEYVEQELQYDTGVEFDVDHDEEETPPLAPPRTQGGGEEFASIYSAQPSTNRLIEKARQAALGYVGITEKDLRWRTQSEFSATNVGECEIQFFRSGLVVVKLVEDQRFYRFDARELLAWKQEQSPPPGPLPDAQRGGEEREPVQPFRPDNAASGGRTGDELSPIIRRDDPRRVVAQYFQGIAVALQYDDAQKALQAILAMSRKAAGELAAHGGLDATLNAHYERIRQAVIAWLEGPISEMLNAIAEAGNEYGAGGDEV